MQGEGEGLCQWVLLFKPPERSCVVQDTFAPCLKCQLLEGGQGLF